MDRQLARERYDLMVLDLMLPGEDGLAICRRLRRMPRRAAGRPSSCSPPRATRWTASSAWRWAPTTTCRSRSTRASWWRASTRCCGAGSPPGRRARPPWTPSPPLRRLRVQPGDAQPRTRRQARRPHHRRVFRAQGPGAASAPAPFARQADGARARPRIRRVRPLHRRADLAPAQNRRGGSSHPRHIQTVWGFGYVFVPDGAPRDA